MIDMNKIMYQLHTTPLRYYVSGNLSGQSLCLELKQSLLFNTNKENNSFSYVTDVINDEGYCRIGDDIV